MLLVSQIDVDNNYLEESAEQLFKINPTFRLYIKAPMYWWLDCDLDEYHTYMPRDDFMFCLDSWDVENNPYIQVMQGEIINNKLTARQLMQILPLSTYLEGVIEITYQQIVEVCENYDFGEYDYEGLYNQWPMSREWSDFCETLMDIKGVREIVEKEGM